MSYEFFLCVFFILLSSVSVQKLNIEELDPNMTLKKDANGTAWFEPKRKLFRLTGFKYQNKKYSEDFQ